MPCKNFIRWYGFYIPITELDLKIAKDIAVITTCIFFGIGPVLIEGILNSLLGFHGTPPLFGL